jgi:hypothetical protein
VSSVCTETSLLYPELGWVGRASGSLGRQFGVIEVLQAGS